MLMNSKAIATNRKAFHDFFIHDRWEAGMVLTGSEIKSIRAGRVNLRDSYVAIRQGEAWLIGSHVSAYLQASRQNHDPRRERKLLLHRREIDRLDAKVRERGFTIIPLRLYLKDGRAKVEIALASGKRKYDKRQALAEKDAKREMDRAAKHRNL